VADVLSRLGEFDEARGVPAGPDQMGPPAGIFLVGYVDGEFEKAL